MTEHEYQTLLDLANTWQKIADTFRQTHRNAMMRVEAARRREDNVDEDMQLEHAKSAEIRADVLAGAAKKLALKLGQLYTARSAPKKEKRPFPAA